MSRITFGLRWGRTLDANPGQMGQVATTFLANEGKMTDKLLWFFFGMSFASAIIIIFQHF